MPRLLAALVAGLAFAGCAGDTGTIALATNTEAASSVNPAGSREYIVDSTPRGTLQGSDLRQRLLLRPRPPKIIAMSLSELPEELGFAARATAGDKSRTRGARWTEAAQIGLLFGSPEGKAFLSGKEGRALVRGAPAKSCPVMNVALSTTDDTATEGAMRSCLDAVSAYPDCGCRLIARGDHLLASRDDFAYAIGVGTRIVDPTRNEVMTYASEERIVDGRPGARHVWLLGLNGPVGLLQVERDGRAALTIEETGERYDGVHKADGFRRGRIARRAYLTAPDGRNIIVLVGYEDTELKENQAALTAWNPHGSLILKTAEAE